MNDFSLLFTIVRRDLTDAVLELYDSNEVTINYVVPCNGTARIHTLNLMGLEQTEKSLILSLTTESHARALRERLMYAISFNLPDTGVAFTVPISGLDGRKTFEYIVTCEGGDPALELAKVISEESTEKSDNQKEENKMDAQNELIIAICEAGYTDLVMDAARAAGARGGTTIKAKGTGVHNAEKFFGVTIARERELVLIVCPSEKRNEIMTAIKKDAGITTKAHTLMFSLPVSSADGFGSYLISEEDEKEQVSE